MSVPGVSAPASVQLSSQNSAASAQASLGRLLAKYQAGISKGPGSQDLASLARQINAAAKALGQPITLPPASGHPAAAANDSMSKSTSQEAAPNSVDLTV